jgi:hypothetical protein
VANESAKLSQYISGVPNVIYLMARKHFGNSEKAKENILEI